MHPPHTPDDASRIQNIIHTPTQLPTYNNASRTRRTPPTPDDASRMQNRHKTCATSPGPGPLVYSMDGWGRLIDAALACILFNSLDPLGRRCRRTVFCKRVFVLLGK